MVTNCQSKTAVFFENSAGKTRKSCMSFHIILLGDNPAVFIVSFLVLISKFLQEFRMVNFNNFRKRIAWFNSKF